MQLAGGDQVLQTVVENQPTMEGEPRTPTPPSVRAVDASFDIVGDYDVEMSSTVWLSRDFSHYIHWK